MPGYARPTNAIPSQELLFNPFGDISSITVQDAIEELDVEKQKNVLLQSNPPSTPSSGELWIDNTDSAKPILKVYDGTSWIVAGSSLEVDEDQIILANRMFA